jgi:predicted TIM-barrel fold metal-dependent hydrolase
VGKGELLKNMDAEGVHKSVIFGFPWQKPDHFRRHNDYIIGSVESHPDRLIGFCCFSPLSPEGSREAERCLASGLKGVGELAIYNGGISSEHIVSFAETMAVCSQFDVPLLLHTNEPVGHSYPGKTATGLNPLYHLLKAYPSNRFVLAHWGGGLFFYALMKKEVREVLSRVWFDTAASPYLYVPEVYRLAVEIMGFEKILFGSDYPLLQPKRYMEEMESANLSSQAVKAIAGENAAGLLRLS